MRRIVAKLFEEVPDGRGGYNLRPVTTARLLTPAQAASILGVSDKTMYRKASEGAIPSVRTGRCLRFEPDVIYAHRHSGGTEYEPPKRAADADACAQKGRTS
jgi:excisionase family DNA binding protein